MTHCDLDKAAIRKSAGTASVMPPGPIVEREPVTRVAGRSLFSIGLDGHVTVGQDLADRELAILRKAIFGVSA